MASPKRSLITCFLPNRDVSRQRGQGWESLRRHNSNLVWRTVLPGISRKEIRKTVTVTKAWKVRTNPELENWRRPGKQENVLSGRRHRAQVKGAATKLSQAEKEDSLYNKGRKSGEAGCIRRLQTDEDSDGCLQPGLHYSTLLHLLPAKKTQWKAKGLPCYF